MFAARFFLAALLAAEASCQEASLGAFTASADLGTVGKPGAASFNAATNVYAVTGGGKNMWRAEDACRFVSRPAAGDVALTAEIAWPSAGTDPHRKACLMFRRDFDADSAYVDVAVHGDGLTSLQYRATKGGLTHEIQSSVKAPKRVRLQKEGAYVFLSIADAAGPWRSAGGSFRIDLGKDFHAGLAVCAHDPSNTALETATFRNVEFRTLPSRPTGTVLESTLETIAIASTDRRVVHVAREHFEAPNWSRDGRTLLVNRKGRLVTIPVGGGELKVLDTGTAVKINNDHGYSPDGATIAISDQTADRKSRIYLLPATGGTPTLVTPLAPSYWHGWSPDGKALAYCAERHGEFDIYTIPAAGGDERRLTDAKGLDDGPDYSPDGKHIYFNSNRTGTMRVWRMNADGSEQTQWTNDGFNDWFPHPSPDGKWLAFVSFGPEVQGHPANQDVSLRLMPAAGGPPKTIATLFGGQGTMNVPSWSPDSQRLAFVSYRLTHAEDP